MTIYHPKIISGDWLQLKRRSATSAPTAPQMIGEVVCDGRPRLRSPDLGVSDQFGAMANAAATAHPGRWLGPSAVFDLSTPDGSNGFDRGHPVPLRLRPHAMQLRNLGSEARDLVLDDLWKIRGEQTQ